MDNAIIPNTCWKHNNSGCIYLILMLANTEGNDPEKKDKYPPTVVYKDINNGKIWAGRLDDWHRRMTIYIPAAGDIND